MDVVLDDGKTCANVTHGAQRGRAGEGMDVVIVGIEGMCEQGMLFGEVGGLVRARWGQMLASTGELRRGMSCEDGEAAAGGGLLVGRRWFERAIERAPEDVATSVATGSPTSRDLNCALNPHQRLRLFTDAGLVF